MAKKPKVEKKERTANEDLVTRVRERYQKMSDADSTNRQEGMLDFKFVNVPGEQWDAAMTKERGARPCYEFNELRIKCKRIINDMRANRPQAKVRGYEDADKQMADIIEGLCRNIWNTSDADTIIDNAGDFQVSAGMGAWRVVTDYESEQSFDQDIYVEAIPNPLGCLYWDPAAKDGLKRDAEDWILTERISKKAYEAKYPNKEMVDFDSDAEDDDEWTDEETVRIAEYWYKEPVTVTVCKLADGRVIEKDGDEYETNTIPVLAERQVKSHRIMMCVVSGDAVLEKPKVCAGKQHRFIVVFGEQMIVDGKWTWWGLPRFSKDSQRNLNLTNTAAMEATARWLQAPYWMTAKQAEGHEKGLTEAFKQGYPFAMYNSDPASPGPPQRTGGPELPIAMLELGTRSSELLNSTSGIYQTNVGDRIPGAKSGRAIIATQQQGEIATFNFQDNMAKAVQRTHEIFLDLIPEVYDTARALRVLGADGSDSYVKINEPIPGQVDPVTGTLQKLNDVKRGRFDVTITVGPNFSTKRQEAVEVYGELFSANPALQAVAGDLFFKAMDAPYAEEISERVKATLPPQIQQIINKDKQVPPEVAQGMAQVQQAMQQVQQLGQVVQQAAEEAEQKKAEAEKAEAEVRTAIADLKTQRAQFEAQVAKAEANLQTRAVEIQGTQGQDNLGKEREALTTQVSDALTEIGRANAEFMQEQVKVLAEMQARQSPVLVVPPKPKLLRVDMVKANGKTSAVPIYEQTTLQ
jgi:hypothetical protein